LGDKDALNSIKIKHILSSQHCKVQTAPKIKSFDLYYNKLKADHSRWV